MILIVYLIQIATAFQSLKFGKTYKFTQTKLWNNFNFDYQSGDKENIRISLKILTNSGLNFPVLTLSKELPQFRNNGTDLQADFADYENWFSVNKYQSIILTRLELQEYNYISVGNYFFSNGELVYHLSLENSDLSLCPNNCNSLGVCQSSGSCYCYKDYIGPDCGIKADEITKNSQKILNLNRKIYYMYVDLLKIDGSIDIKIKWNHNPAKLLINYKGQLKTYLPSENSYYMAVSLINSNQTQNIRVDLNDIDDYLYVAIINDGQESEITFEVWYQENRKHSDILGTLYVILSVVGIVILIIGMICIFRKKCRRPIAKIQSDLIGISHELMSKQFPIMKFSNVRSPSNTTCSICFETYNHNSCIRRLYCDHLFCAMCIEEWFKTSKTCCLCKRDCSILEDQVFSNEFWKRAHANSINLQMNHINITEIN